ncbi:MAG: FAD-dependent oxidoreductase [Cyanobacteria bacterium SW_9_44_58]|nr:MAG: FAD-dependent oxidoreductase [Cyanobacteria bacterium SW_9_44_58]
MKQVVIIGGGIVGATIAYELSQNSQLSITLIDREAPAQASTGAALGLLMGIISQKNKGRDWQLREASMRRYPQLLAEITQQTGDQIPQVQGLLHLCFSQQEKDQAEKLAALRCSQGWNLEIWEVPQLQTHCPYIETANLTGAIYSPQDFQVHPKALTNTLIKASQQNGASCRWGVEATNVSANGNRNGRHCRILHTNQGDWETDYLIVAAGLGSFPLTRQLQHPLTLSPVLGQAMRVRLDKNLKTSEFQPVVTGDDIHVIPLGNGEYWVGATVEFPDEQGNVKAEKHLLDGVWEKAIAFCPPLAQGEIVETWSGKRPRPEGQAAPVIEYLEGYDNVILATGHYRNGVLLAPGTAEAVKQLMSH